MLRARLGWDSSTSGCPLSLDSPFVKRSALKRSSRGWSGKDWGKQHGAPGSTLELVDDPDVTVVGESAACRGCGDALDGALVFVVSRRQVFEVSPGSPRPHVTEHRVAARTFQDLRGLRDHTRRDHPARGTTPPVGASPVGASLGVPSGRVRYGPGIKARAVWLGGAHFLPVRRAREVVNALGGFAVSAGWVAGLRGPRSHAQHEAQPRVDGPDVRWIEGTDVLFEHRPVDGQQLRHVDHRGFRQAARTLWQLDVARCLGEPHVRGDGRDDHCGDPRPVETIGRHDQRGASKARRRADRLTEVDPPHLAAGYHSQRPSSISFRPASAPEGT